jgi:hypothetical protein
MPAPASATLLLFCYFKGILKSLFIYVIPLIKDQRILLKRATGRGGKPTSIENAKY